MGKGLGEAKGMEGLPPARTPTGEPLGDVLGAAQRVDFASFVPVSQGPSPCRDSFPAVKPCMGKGGWMTHTVPFSHG